MSKLNKIVKTLCKTYHCELLRDSKDFQKDIDLYCNKDNYPNVRSYLSNEGFYFKETKYQLSYYCFFDKELKQLDILTTKDSPNYFFNLKLNINPLLDTKNSRFLRYFLMLRTDRCLFYQSYKSDLINTRYCQSFVSEPIYKKKPDSLQTFLNILNRNHFAMLKHLKLKHYLSFILRQTKKYVNAFNKGQIIAFMGPDGVGKSTIINILSTSLNTKNIYMGGKEFKYETFYKKNETKKYLKPLIFLMRYTEQWQRQVKIRIWKLRGKIVLIDRYPKWDLILHNNPRLLRRLIYLLTYRFFYPTPDKIIILYLDSEAIYKRKGELSVPEINKFQQLLKEQFHNHPKSTFILNDSLNKTLNACLSQIFNTTINTV